MNIDFATLGGTAWTVAGSMIVACMFEILSKESIERIGQQKYRWFN
jgi:hypothetical protein